MARYNPKETEPRWRKAWADADAFRAVIDPSRPKYYVLEMFPYPSGRLHMGHVRNYALGDVIARFKRARGFSVLHPMGWDAFGLPAENAAIERGVDPKGWTYENIARMRDELKELGLSIDWSREFATCDLAYYGQQQALFLDLFEQGLVYRKEGMVNWDPVDMTVLANEQVVDGRGWRSGAVVEKRKLNQWFFRITDYADQLTDDLATLDRWPEKVRVMQENWIGRSKGLKFAFAFAGAAPAASRSGLEVYTTRPDTLFGASFVAIAADHPLAERVAAGNPGAAAFIAECKKGGASQAEIDTAEKLGFDTGLKVNHPFDPAWDLPVWIANFILMDYGTGAIFACPAHDQRDLDFCRKYKLPVIPVVLPPGEDPATFDVGDEAYVGPGVIYHSQFLDGLDIEAAKGAAIARIEGPGPGRGRDHIPSARLGRGSAARLGLPHPGGPLRQSTAWFPCRRPRFPSPCPTTWNSASRAMRWSGTRPGSTRSVPSAAARRRGRPIRWTPSWTAPGTTPASPTRTSPSRSTRPPPTTGCRWTSTSAASSTPCCTCSTRASSPRPWLMAAS